MNVIQQFGSAFVNAARAFRLSFLGKTDAPGFEAYDARVTRYSLLWSLYENTAYQSIHGFAESFKYQYGLYRSIRGIYNPVLRIGDFWRSHLLGGSLDPDAGDGTETPSALPIITDNNALRRPLAALWRASNMQQLKDILSLRTSIMGDGALMVVDNPNKGRVSLSWLNPMFLKDIELDLAGNVKGYTIEYITDHPVINSRQAKYTEIASRDGDDVVYQTLLDGALFAWDDNGAEWSVPYGFIPMVVFQHNNVGLRWGWSELQAGLPKFREVDDLASKLSDYTRKLVDAPMLYAGVKAPDTTGRVDVKPTTRPDAQTAREAIPALYSSDANAKAIPIIAELDIAAASGYLDTLLRGIEYDYPELGADLHNVKGDPSEESIRLNREPSENKVLMRRGDYDYAIVRAHQMAVAIGGWRGYEGYQGFGLESYDRGDLDHRIGHRPVFAKDPTADIKHDGLFWDTANKAKAAGVPLPVFLRQQGWDDDKIADITSSEEYALRLDASRAAVEGAKAAASQPAPQPPGVRKPPESKGKPVNGKPVK